MNRRTATGPERRARDPRRSDGAARADRSDAARPGFTLVETLVALAILAVLAALVVPTVGSQMEKADPTRLAADLDNLQTAGGSFGVDVRAVPADGEDLTARPDGGDTDIRGRPYTDVQIERWDGPYLDVGSAPSARDEPAIPTGYGGTIYNGFLRVDPRYGSPPGSLSGHLDADCRPEATLASSGRSVAAVIGGLAEDQFQRANDQVDGEEKSDAEAATTGKLRFHQGAGCTVTFYLVNPSGS